MSCDFDGRERTRALPDASLVRVQNSRASPGDSLRVYCIYRVLRYTIIDFYLCITILSSSFCLFLRSVSVVERSALQECLKEAAEEPV